MFFLLIPFQAIYAESYSEEASSNPKRLFMRFGIENGGEDVIDFKKLRINHDISDEDIFLSGGLLSASIGIRFDHSSLDSSQSTELSIGIKRGERNALNHHFTFTRIPIDLIRFLVVDDIKLGAGLTYHLNPQLKASGNFSDLSENFDNEFGFILQGDYQTSTDYWLGVRATIIKYHTPTRPVGGESLGFTLTKFF